MRRLMSQYPIRIIARRDRRVSIQQIGAGRQIEIERRTQLSVSERSYAEAIHILSVRPGTSRHTCVEAVENGWRQGERSLQTDAAGMPNPGGGRYGGSS